jgi:hypothetical protein
MPPFPAPRLATVTLHRPRVRVLGGHGLGRNLHLGLNLHLGRNLRPGRNLRLGPKPFRSAHRIDPWLRRRRFLIEAVATVLATTFLTSLALAHPAVLRNDPGTTLQAVGSQLLTSLVASPSPLLHDCP